MPIQKAIEILTIFKNESTLYSTPDLKEALIIALTCMQYIDTMMTALGKEELKKLL